MTRLFAGFLNTAWNPAGSLPDSLYRAIIRHRFSKMFQRGKMQVLQIWFFPVLLAGFFDYIKDSARTCVRAAGKPSFLTNPASPAVSRHPASLAIPHHPASLKAGTMPGRCGGVVVLLYCCRWPCLPLWGNVIFLHLRYDSGVIYLISEAIKNE